MGKSIDLALLQFETNTRCNARCSFCMHKHMTRKGEMPLHQIIDIIYHLGYKAKQICPFGMQEPLLESRLPQILTNCKVFAPSAETLLYSNMSVYPEDTWRKILEWGVLDKFIISFYGTTKETYQKLQPPLNYERTCENIRRFMKLKQKLGWARPEVTLEILITPETYMKAQEMHDEYKPIVDRVGYTHLDSWGGHIAVDYELEEKLFGAPPPRTPCTRLWSAMNIHFNGNVTMCCLDYNDEYVIGNVFDDGFDVWWESSKLKEYRDLHAQGRWNEIPLCRECSAWRYNHPEEWIEYWKKSALAPSASSP